MGLKIAFCKARTSSKKITFILNFKIGVKRELVVIVSL